MSATPPELPPEPPHVERRHPPRRRPVDHAKDLERTIRAVAVYVIAVLFVVCMIKSRNLGTCCGPVSTFLGTGAAATPTPTPAQ